jgi:hypothetical protein
MQNIRPPDNKTSLWGLQTNVYYFLQKWVYIVKTTLWHKLIYSISAEIEELKI